MVTFLGPENGHGFGPLNPENEACPDATRTPGGYHKKNITHTPRGTLKCPQRQSTPEWNRPDPRLWVDSEQILCRWS